MKKLQEKTGYKFKKDALLKEALSHPSLGGDKSYERLEFLGDAVLGLIISEMLYKNFPDDEEGHLAKKRAALVCGESLAKIAREINLGEHILMNAGEENANGRDNSANLENVLEALAGAIYLDGGLKAAQNLIEKYFSKLLTEMPEAPKDPKTELQEWAQARGLPIPDYNIIEQQGPAHAPLFKVEVSVEGHGKASAEGNSKKMAEREAAKLLLEKIKI